MQTQMTGKPLPAAAVNAQAAKVDHKSELVEIDRERLEEQRAQTEILSRMADSQVKFQSDLLELLRKSTNS